MNVLLSTTIGHNPGDEIIADGVKSLLKLMYPHSQLNFVHYNRNPDQQFGEGREARAKTIGNYQCGDVDLSYIDLVVLAGSPEWALGPMKALYEAVLASNIQILALGIGLGDPNLKLTDLDVRALKKCSMITTRSTETTEFLKQHGIQSKAFVCPALFSAVDGFAAAFPGAPLLRITQMPGLGWHEINANALVGLIGTDLGFLHVKELKYFCKHVGRKVYMSSSSEFRDKVSYYGQVHSTRLHGAVGALALGIPAVVVTHGDFRIETAARMFGEYLPIVKTFDEALSIPRMDEMRVRDFVNSQKEIYLKEMFAI